jgi:regulator of protease activity HflC (stomatin/prohibitin superfamily)
MVSEAIARGEVHAINYFLGLKYIEAFKELAASNNQKFVLIPMESAGILGSIAGIGEIAKLASEKSANMPPRTPGSVPTIR